MNPKQHKWRRSGIRTLFDSYGNPYGRSVWTCRKCGQEILRPLESDRFPLSKTEVLRRHKILLNCAENVVRTVMGS